MKAGMSGECFVPLGRLGNQVEGKRIETGDEVVGVDGKELQEKGLL
jgi:hypothetical protein